MTKEKNYKFEHVINEFKNSQDRIKEIWLYSNEGKYHYCDNFLGAIIFYKDGNITFEKRGIVRYVAAPEEIQFIAKYMKEVLKKQN